MGVGGGGGGGCVCVCVCVCSRVVWGSPRFKRRLEVCVWGGGQGNTKCKAGCMANREMVWEGLALGN